MQPLLKLRETGLAVPSPVGRERVRVRVDLFDTRFLSGNCFCTNLWLKTRNLKRGTAQRPSLRLRPQGFQPTDRVAPQAVKFTPRQHHAPPQAVLNFSKLEGGPAEPTK